MTGIQAGDIGKEDEETIILEPLDEPAPGEDIPAEPAIPLPAEPVPA
jgi:hypothetical protein